MSDVLLVLGPIAFQAFEVPSGINFGGRQALAVHHLPGGTRIIDAVGRDDSLISFNGIFTGPDATLRARMLDTLRVAGTPVQLTWDIFFYTVIIAEFAADYRNGWWIPYRIVCTVLQDEASITTSIVQSLMDAVLADIGWATELAASASVDLSALAPALAASNTTTRGTDNYCTAVNALTSAQSTLGASVNTANMTICGPNLLAPLSAVDGVNNLLLVADTAGRLGVLTIANAYLARAVVNLCNAST